MMVHAAHRHRPFSFYLPGLLALVFCLGLAAGWYALPWFKSGPAPLHSRIAYQFSYGLLMGVCLVGLTGFLYRFQPLLLRILLYLFFSALVFVVFCAIYELKTPPSGDLGQLPGERWAMIFSLAKMMPFCWGIALCYLVTPLFHYIFHIRRPSWVLLTVMALTPIAAVVIDQLMPWYTIITLDYPVGAPIAEQSLENRLVMLRYLEFTILAVVMALHLSCFWSLRNHPYRRLPAGFGPALALLAVGVICRLAPSWNNPRDFLWWLCAALLSATTCALGLEMLGKQVRRSRRRAGAALHAGSVGKGG